MPTLQGEVWTQKMMCSEGWPCSKRNLEGWQFTACSYYDEFVCFFPPEWYLSVVSVFKTLSVSLCQEYVGEHFQGIPT